MAGYGRGKAKKFRRFRRFRKKMFRKLRKYGNAPRKWYPLGYTQSARLRYVETITINPDVAMAGDYVFSANGLYDPNVTGIGHQPYGFDELMAMYSHYAVIGSKITVKLAGTQSSEYWAGICLRNSATSLAGSSLTNLLEAPGHNLRMIYQSGDAHLARGNSISCKFSAKKFFTAKTSAIVSDAQYNGSIDSRPTEQAYFHVILAPAHTQDLVSQPITVIIDFYTIFSEPKTLPQS